MTDAKNDPGSDAASRKPLAGQTGFWRRVQDEGRLRKTDVFRLREDLQRLEEMTRQIDSGKTCCTDVAAEVERVRGVVMKDYATQALVIQTLIEILLDKGVMTEDEFEDKLDEIDGRDGRRDGMLAPRTAGDEGESATDATGARNEGNAT